MLGGKRGWARTRRRTKVEEQRRAIRVMTRRQTWVANSSQVLDSDRLLYEYACVRTHIDMHTKKEKEREGEREGMRQRNSLIRGETLPPVAPLLAFQMKDADERTPCTRQLRQRVSQLGMSCVWNGCWWSDCGQARRGEARRGGTDSLCPSASSLPSRSRPPAVWLFRRGDVSARNVWPPKRLKWCEDWKKKCW